MKSFNSGIISVILSTILLSGCNVAKYGINYTKTAEPRFAALHAHPELLEQASVQAIKVVTYNIEFAKKIDKAIDILTTHEKLKGADIIFLQEMDDRGVQRIAQALGYNYVYYPAVFHPIPKQNFGNAILSKWPIFADQKVILEDEDSEKLQRIAAVAQIKIGDRIIHISSIHMRIRLKPFIRRSQIERVVHAITDESVYAIVAGDFNTFYTHSLNEIVDEFTRHTYQFATEGVGWTHQSWYSLLKRSKTDHIFSKGFHVKEAGKVPERRASDHLPVWSILEFQ